MFPCIMFLFLHLICGNLENDDKNQRFGVIEDVNILCIETGFERSDTAP